MLEKNETIFCSPVFGSILGRPLSLSRTTDLIGISRSSVRSNRSASVRTTGSCGGSGWVSAVAAT